MKQSPIQAWTLWLALCVFAVSGTVTAQQQHVSEANRLVREMMRETSATNVRPCSRAIEYAGAIHCATYPYNDSVFFLESEGLATLYPNVEMSSGEGSFLGVVAARVFTIDGYRFFAVVTSGQLVVFRERH